MNVYDITDSESFKSVEMWAEEIEKYATPGVSKLLIGNKMDMDGDRKVSKEQGETLAKHYNIKFLETSAKSSINVLEAFKTMTREMYNRSAKKNTLKDTPKDNGTRNAKSMALFLRVVGAGKVVLSKTTSEDTSKKQK